MGSTLPIYQILQIECLWIQFQDYGCAISGLGRRWATLMRFWFLRWGVRGLGALDLEHGVCPGSGESAHRRRNYVDPNGVILVGHYCWSQASHWIHWSSGYRPAMRQSVNIQSEERGICSTFHGICHASKQQLVVNFGGSDEYPASKTLRMIVAPIAIPDSSPFCTQLQILLIRVTGPWRMMWHNVGDSVA